VRVDIQFKRKNVRKIDCNIPFLIPNFSALCWPTSSIFLLISPTMIFVSSFRVGVWWLMLSSILNAISPNIKEFEKVNITQKKSKTNTFSLEKLRNLVEIHCFSIERMYTLLIIFYFRAHIICFCLSWYPKCQDSDSECVKSIHSFVYFCIAEVYQALIINTQKYWKIWIIWTLNKSILLCENNFTTADSLYLELARDHQIFSRENYRKNRYFY